MGLGAVGAHDTQGGEAVNSCKSVKKIYLAINVANAPVIPSTCICQSPLHILPPPIPSYQHTKVGVHPWCKLAVAGDRPACL
jgi:hypothetical protein